MGSKTMQQPQRVGFRTANGDTGLQGANMPQNQPQQQWEMPDNGGMPFQPMGQPMPPMTGGGTPQIPQTYPGAMHSPTPGQPFPGGGPSGMRPQPFPGAPSSLTPMPGSNPMLGPGQPFPGGPAPIDSSMSFNGRPMPGFGPQNGY
jgi:hypothetical protein